MLRRLVAVALAAGVISLGDAPVGAFVAGPKPLFGGMWLSLFRMTAVLNEGNSTVTTFEPASGFDATPVNVLSGPHVTETAQGLNSQLYLGNYLAGTVQNVPLLSSGQGRLRRSRAE